MMDTTGMNARHIKLAQGDVGRGLGRRSQEIIVDTVSTVHVVVVESRHGVAGRPRTHAQSHISASPIGSKAPSTAPWNWSETRAPFEPVPATRGAVRPGTETRRSCQLAQS